MFKVGITGNFYSGYDVVAEIFEEKGVPVFDADVIIKYILNYSYDHINKIKEVFGPNIYQAGLLDLSKFDTNLKFDKLFEIIQLDIFKKYETWRIKNWDSIYTIFKCSVLFERKFNDLMNFTITTYKPKHIRKSDLRNHTSMPLVTIDNIIDGEMDELVKNQKSTFVVHNYHTIEQLRSQIDQIHKSLISKNVNNDRFYHVKNIIM